MRKKALIFVLSALVISGASLAQVLNKKSKNPKTVYKTVPEELSANLPEVKNETKSELEPFRYDGTKVTYFIYKTFEQRKEVEIFFFSNNEYKVIFNSKLINEKDPIQITIYDQPRNIAGRHVLKQASLTKGGENVEINSKELLKTLKAELEKENANKEDADKIDTDNVTLQKVYIDYIIPSMEKQVEIDDKANERIVTRTKGAIVMAMGYNNV